jgi:hypothetical protein
MKNVNGLREAMAVVESACEKGEITIIGEGAMPSAPDMLVKCAEFLVNKMGADVRLLAVVNDAVIAYNDGKVSYEGKNAPCSCGCPACCEDEDEDEEPTLAYDCDREEMVSAVCVKIAEYFSFCTDAVKAEIRDITMEVIENLVGITEDEYNGTDICDNIGGDIYDAYGGLDNDNIDEYANAIADIISENISWE